MQRCPPPGAWVKGETRETFQQNEAIYISYQDNLATLKRYGGHGGAVCIACKRRSEAFSATCPRNPPEGEGGSTSVVNAAEAA